MTERRHGVGGFVKELRRRRVFRVVTAYVGFGLAAIYAADAVLPRLGAPEWSVTLVVVLVVSGLVLAVGLSWAYDVTPTGLTRASERPTEPTAVTPPPDADAGRAPSGGEPPDRCAIAVLPFENMSSDADNDHFSDGISEEIINALAQLPELRVAGRTSAFSFKGRHEDLREVGRKLNVGTVLEGSVRKAGNRVRITAQLIDTADGYHLWSEKYDRDLHDIFQVQDEIAQAIAERLTVKLGGRASAPLIAHHPDDPEAYQLFLTGRHYVAQMMEPGFTRAIDAYRAAIARAPEYALAWAGIGEAEMIRGAIMDEPYEASPSRARDAALKALELDDGIAEAHATMGSVLAMCDLEWDAAEERFRRALELSPGSAWAHTWYGDLLAWTGRTGEAVREARRAGEVEPLASLFRVNILQNLWLDGRLDEADRESRRTLELFPEAYYAHFFLGIVAWCRGNAEEALAGMERSISVAGPLPILVSPLAAACYHFGRRERGDELFDQLRQRAREGHVSAGAFVPMYIARGQTDAAIRSLRDGRARKDVFLCQLKTMLRALPLATPPEVAEEMERLGFR